MGMEDPEERKMAEGWLSISQKAILAEDMKSWLLRNAMKKSHEFSFEMFENVCGFTLCCGIHRTWRLSAFLKIIRLW